ncbi:hypothetical protein KIPB_007415 [Kipferlia bialata]|uniref:Uncharacterized protein n=1 Tax=Kipferlia bialata TaxID=797122 RepID=A0A9K3D0U8_9EUKA|nr:hypothetical protein KIPB_007415 [Kipferlia bialata]|eukprot:g7415.t1
MPPKPTGYIQGLLDERGVRPVPVRQKTPSGRRRKVTCGTCDTTQHSVYVDCATCWATKLKEWSAEVVDALFGDRLVKFDQEPVVHDQWVLFRCPTCSDVCSIQFKNVFQRRAEIGRENERWCQKWGCANRDRIQEYKSLCEDANLEYRGPAEGAVAGRHNVIVWCPVCKDTSTRRLDYPPICSHCPHTSGFNPKRPGFVYLMLREDKGKEQAMFGISNVPHMRLRRHNMYDWVQQGKLLFFRSGHRAHALEKRIKGLLKHHLKGEFIEYHRIGGDGYKEGNGAKTNREAYWCETTGPWVKHPTISALCKALHVDVGDGKESDYVFTPESFAKPAELLKRPPSTEGHLNLAAWLSTSPINPQSLQSPESLPAPSIPLPPPAPASKRSSPSQSPEVLDFD